MKTTFLYNAKFDLTHTMYDVYGDWGEGSGFLGVNFGNVGLLELENTFSPSTKSKS